MTLIFNDCLWQFQASHTNTHSHKHTTHANALIQFTSDGILWKNLFEFMLLNKTLTWYIAPFNELRSFEYFQRWINSLRNHNRTLASSLLHRNTRTQMNELIVCLLSLKYCFFTVQLTESTWFLEIKIKLIKLIVKQLTTYLTKRSFPLSNPSNVRVDHRRTCHFFFQKSTLYSNLRSSIFFSL